MQKHVLKDPTNTKLEDILNIKNEQKEQKQQIKLIRNCPLKQRIVETKTSDWSLLSSSFGRKQLKNFELILIYHAIS